MADITENRDGGVLKEVKATGPVADDRPWTGDRVVVHYTGKLEDGTVFDSSRGRGEKFAFNLGKSEVIRGWDVGVATMSRGELANFTIRSDYAYGDMGSPPKIPGGATLIFEVELFDFFGTDLSEKNDKSLLKRTIDAGEGFDKPNDGSTVTIGLVGRRRGENKPFDERDVTFVLGEGIESDVPAGIETALMKMLSGEKAQIDMAPSHAKGCKSVSSDNESRLVYEIHLKSFERCRESWQLEGSEKLEQAAILKAKGTEFFKAGKYSLAAAKYKKISEFLEHEISLKNEKEDERKALLKAGRLNLIMCHLKSSEWIEAKDLCDKVLADEPDHPKALFRRGEALIALHEPDLAKQDFQRLLSVEPENKAAKNKVAVCAHSIKLIRDKDRKTFANMFDKFAKQDLQMAEDAKRREKPLEINEWGKKDDTEANVIPVGGDVNMDINVDEVAGENCEEKL